MLFSSFAARLAFVFCVLGLLQENSRAFTVDATFSSAADVPVTGNGYTASGNSVAFNLGYPPETGTTLTVVKNTGPGFIGGVFSNLSQGQEVSLAYGDKTYKFAANYFGGSGNDLVLQWAATRAVGFGYNQYGQLGNGSTANSNLQVAVTSTGVLAGKTVTAIEAGGRHSLALCSDGTVAAWGYNSEGQLGNNSTADSSVPVAVNRSGVLSGKRVVAIAAGNSHSVALCSDGTLATWGGNTHGQAGSGNDTTGWFLTPVAVDTTGVLAGKTVVAVAAGANHTLALCSDGTLAAWGHNYEGELGNGEAFSERSSPVAVDRSGVLSGKTVTGISAGEYHSLVVCSDGSMAAWGHDADGSFGNGGPNSTSTVPVAAGTTGALSGKSAVAVACGNGHSMTLCSDGSLGAWGYGSYGQLGINYTGSYSIPVAVISNGVLSGKTITTLAGGKFFSLAMCSDGTLATWGDNYNGQLGDNSTIERDVPVAVTTATLATGEKFVMGTSSPTAYHSLAIVAMPYIPRIVVEHPVGIERKNGRAALDFGSYPAGSTISKTFMLRNNGIVPLTITGVTLDGTDASDFAVTTPPAASVAAGSTTSLTVTFTAGAGFNRSASLHIASNDPYTGVFNLDLGATVARAFPIVFGSDSDVPVNAKVFTATASTVSLSLNFMPSTGTTLTVVNNTGLGFISGSFGNLSQGQEVALPYNGTTYRFVANYFGGTGNDLVLQWSTTRLLAWGDNFSGQLGTGSTAYADRPAAVAAAGALAGKTILSTANGFDISLAVCSDGTVASWGGNFAGQLGNGSTANSSVPVAVDPSGVLAGKRVVAVSAGYNHCVALCSDGTLAAWGGNDRGKLGDGGYTSSSVPVAMNQAALSGKSVVAVSAGYSSSLALCSDGTVLSWGYPETGQVNTFGALSGKTVVSISAGNSSGFAVCSDGTAVGWGSNSLGQLGIGTFDNNSPIAPTALYTGGALSGKTVAAISGGYDHGLARCPDGTLFTWGSNSYGQLGNGTNTDSNAPVAVDLTGVLAGRTVVAANAGYQYNLARCSDGTLVAWGNGSAGRLGNGASQSKNIPVVVKTTALIAGEKIVAATTSHYSIHNLAMVAIPAIPRIALEQPAGVPWTSGRGAFDFGSSTPGNGIAKTFTLRNTGIEPLAVGGVTIDGTNAADFVLNTLPSPTVAAGASTTFTVTFAASTGNARSAVLHLASNDPYTSEFRLEMTGAVAGSLNIAYTTGAEIPVSAPAFTATGSNVYFSLSQAPGTGSELTIVRNAGLNFINGTFGNLAQGQIVVMEFAGIAYRFVANYYGGSGNDLVLQWAATRPFAWGNNASGQLGIGSTTSKSTPTAISTTGVLAGKTILSLAAGYSHSLALCSDGTLAAWGTNDSGQFGNGNRTSSNIPVAAGTTGMLTGKRVVAISAGTNFSLAVCSDGTLAAWGLNSNGVLGNGTTTSSNDPVAVNLTGALAGKTVVAVSAGDTHCLALFSDGTVAAWGYNVYGQLGDDSVISRTTPVAVVMTGGLEGKTVIAVDAGYYHSLALCSDGTLASWGDNDNGQLGDSGTISSSIPVAVVTSGVLSGKTVMKAAAGSYHSVALCTDGTVATWGSNLNYALGTGSGPSSAVPAAVTTTGALSGQAPVDVNAKGTNNLVVASNGKAAAWGNNSSGQLGDNSTSTRTLPVAVSTATLAYGEKFLSGATVMGASHAVALVAVPYIPRLVLEQPASNGLTSGSSSVDFPGTSPDSATSKTFTVRNSGIVALALSGVTISGPQASEFVLTSSPATTLEPGASTTLTITFTSGAGFSRRAELHLASNDPSTGDFRIDLTSSGIGTLAATYSSAADVPIVSPGFSATGSTVNFSLAYPPATGTTLTVVKNTAIGPIQGTFGNLAQGQEIVLIQGGKKYRFVANYFGGDGNDLVLQWADVRQFSWGRNSSGQSGTGGTTTSNQPVNVSTPGFLAGKSVASVAAGGSHSLALYLDGTVAAWGLGSSGQLGNGFTSTRYVPDPVNLAGVLAGKKVVAISAGLTHSLALCSDGIVAAWGNNTYGQLGNGTYSNAITPVAVNTTGVLLGKTVIAIAAGQYHSLALCSDGTLASWGDNSSGQLGSGDNITRNVPVAVNRASVLSGKTIVSIAAGLAHSLVLCSDRTLSTWGSNTYGQLGTGGSPAGNLPVIVTAGPGLAGKTPVAIAAGDVHNLVLCSDGSLAAWGYNLNGQLGNGSTSNSSVPVSVNMTGVLAGKNITAIAAGNRHSLVLASDGTVAAWGWNFYGQLGDGTTVQRTLPVAANQANLSLGERVIAVSKGSESFHNLAIVAAPAPNLTATEVWRMTYFQTISNTGAATDLANPQNDGIVNLMKFATGMNPTQSGRMPGVLNNSGENLTFTYSRGKAAVLDGITFTVEWSNTLASGDWHKDGVLQTEDDRGDTHQVTASLPAGNQPAKFVRLRVDRP